MVLCSTIVQPRTYPIVATAGIKNSTVLSEWSHLRAAVFPLHKARCSCVSLQEGVHTLTHTHAWVAIGNMISTGTSSVSTLESLLPMPKQREVEPIILHPCIAVVF